MASQALALHSGSRQIEWEGNRTPFLGVFQLFTP